MAKLAQWEKKELLSVYRSERAKDRCILVKKYTDECKELTKKLDITIKQLRDQLCTTEREKDLLIENNFFGNLIPPKYGCNVSSEHPVLEKFDAETNNKIQDIIRS